MQYRRIFSIYGRVVTDLLMAIINAYISKIVCNQENTGQVIDDNVLQVGLTRDIIQIWNAAMRPTWTSLPLTSPPAASLIELNADSGAQAMHSTTCSCSVSCRGSALPSPLDMAHTRIVWSFEQLAINAPSGDTRTIRTHSRWPLNVFTQYLTTITCIT